MHIRQFREDIKAETWQNVIDIHNPNSTFMKIFTDKYNKHFPLRPVKATKVRLNQSPWIIINQKEKTQTTTNTNIFSTR
jgi:hypothetical protein